MIPVDNTQTIDSIGARSVAKVTATAKNIPFLICAVTDRIYQDKPGAIVREYLTNAWDEHIKNNRPVSDIVLSLPTLDDPNLRIRDFGMGLTLEQVRDIYCLLGESTKRDSNELNGQLGLGCKSAFGYGDSFVVTSWSNGVKKIYNIIKGDDTKEGDVLLMGETPMGEDEKTGIEVSIPIRIGDIHTIHSKAADFLKYWVVLPNILHMDEHENARMMKWRTDAPILSGEDWEIRPNTKSYGKAESFAVMGQVAYPINWDILKNKLALTSEKRILIEILTSNEVILNFPIGSLKFTISREALEYTETTFKSLEDKFEDIFKSLLDSVKEKFTSASSMWEAKRVYLSLFGRNLRRRESDDDEYSPEFSSLKFLSGDFYRLEELFKNLLVWNGIPLDSPYFSKMNEWDVEHPNELMVGKDPTKPCLVPYCRKRSRVKKLNCNSHENNRITPYDNIKVIVLDGRNVSLMNMVARYYLLQEDKNVSKVFFLRFANDAQRERFLAHYHLDPSSYTNVSTIADEVKAWHKATRRSYSRSGGGTSVLSYFNLETENIEESEVSLRELEDGGVYVECRRKMIIINGREVEQDYVASYLKILFAHSYGDVDRVYCLPEAKLKAKWFQEAKKDGVWTEASEYLKENFSFYVSDSVREDYHRNDFIKNRGLCGCNISDEYLHAIVEKLRGVKSEFSPFESFSKENTKVNFNRLGTAIRIFGLPEIDFGKPTVDYRKCLTKAFEKYPMLAWAEVNSYYLQDNKVNAIVEYIKMMEKNS